MKKLFWLLAFLCLALPAEAQFPDQRTYVASSGGSANAQTLAVPNYTLNVGVVIRGRMSFTNTGPMTLNVNGSGVIAVKKQTSAGLAALAGGEVTSGQVSQFLYDGTQYEWLGGGGSGGGLGGAPTGSIDISAFCSTAILQGTGDATTCVQATIDYAFANNITTVTCPSGSTMVTSALIYQDPPSNLRAAPVGQPKFDNFNMTFMAYGGSSDSRNGGENCEILPNFSNSTAWIIGSGRGMVLRGLTIGGPNGFTRGQLPSTGIGIQVSDGASRTLIDNVMVSNYYSCMKFGGNYNNTLADSNTVWKSHVANCFNGLYFPSGNDDVNTVFDTEIESVTNSIRGGSPVNVVGGNFSGSNASHTFTMASVSTLTPYTTPLTNVPSWTFTATITNPDTLLPGNNVYDSFAINTTHYGVIPLTMVSYSSGTATFAIYGEFLQSQYYSENILSTTTIQTDIQAATTVYAAERLRILTQGVFTVTNLWVEEDPTGAETLIEGQGGATASKISGIFYNNDPAVSGQTTNPNFYIMQSFPFIDMPGTLGGSGLAGLEFSDFNVNQQQFNTQDRVIINGAAEYDGHYRFHDNSLLFWAPNLTTQCQNFGGGTGTNQGFCFGFGSWDQTPWITASGSTGDASRQFGGWNYSPFHGYIPDQSTTPCITPTQLATLSTTLPTLVTGSVTPYSLMFGGVTYRVCDWTGVPTHMFVMSNHHFYTYGQQLTTSNVTGLSWTYTGGSDVVYMSANLMARMFNGLQIELNNGSGDVIYMVKGVYPTLGYVTTYRASNTAAQVGMAGTVGTVYTGTTVEQEAYSWTTTQ